MKIMNKYQEAIILVREMLNTTEPNVIKHLSANRKLDHELQELVDKTTPKKPIQKAAGRKVCPNCERSTVREVSPRYCSICGQRLDWSEE